MDETANKQAAAPEAGSGATADLLRGRNISLDFFRGLMALFVCLGHYASIIKFIKVPISFVLSVDFFLVLSGFVLCHSVTQKGAAFSPIAFAKNRYLRIFPVYGAWIALTFPILLYLHLLPMPKFMDAVKIITISEMLPLNAQSASSMAAAFPSLEHCWTISAELYAGIFIFSLYAFLLQKARLLIFPLLFFSIIYTLLILDKNTGGMGNNYKLYGDFLANGTIRCIFDYSIGILAYIIFLRLKPVSNKTLISILQWLSIIACIALYCKFRYHHHDDFFAPFLFAFFIILLAYRCGAVCRLTANKFGEFFGNISYPLYIIHPFFLILINAGKAALDGYPKGFITACYIIICLAAAYLINRYVEKPCLKWLHKA